MLEFKPLFATVDPWLRAFGSPGHGATTAQANQLFLQFFYCILAAILAEANDREAR